MKKLFIPILVLILCSVIVSAGNITAEITALKNTISSDETAEFLLTVNNTGTRNTDLRIYTPDPAWSLETNPSRDKNAWESFWGKLAATRVSLKPSVELGSGLYGVPIVIKDDLVYKESIKSIAFVELTALDRPPGRYVPAVKARVEMGNQVNPTEEFLLRVILENQNLLELDNVTIRITSDLVNKEHVTRLGKWGSKEGKREIDFKINLDPKMPPREDTIRVNIDVVHDGELYIFEGVPHSYAVVAYGGLAEQTKSTKQFLITTEEITLTNDGNTAQTRTYDLSISRFQSWFTKTNPEASVSEETLSWEVNLEVGQTQVLLVETNYRPLFYAFIAVVILIIAYYVFRSPILVRKTVQVTKKSHGGVAELAVQLHLRVRKDLHDIEISDKVPNIFVVSRHFKIGTLHPTKILTHEKKGSIVKWHLDKLEGREERLISYNIKAKLMIVGGFNLPSAYVKYKRKKDTKHSGMGSNQIRLS